jgi:hypothetical protein
MALQVNSSNVAVPTSVAAGNPTDCRAMEAKTVSLEGSMTATYQLQISCDPSDSPASSSWINFSTALTAAGQVFVQQPCTWVRWNCTAYTSGTPVSRCAGMTSFA